MLLQPEHIERRIEKMTDALDRMLMTDVLSQHDYDKAIAELALWADRQYETRRAENA